MSLIRKTLAAAALVAPVALALPAAAQQPTARAGTLTCDVSGGIGYIFSSTREIECVYDPVRGRDERYVGTVRHAGIDLGATSRGIMVWSVLSSSRSPRFPLTGQYVGAAANGSVGVGVGANALVGGSQQGFVLQPISVQAQAGLNVAVGVAELTLEPVRPLRQGRLQ